MDTDLRNFLWNSLSVSYWDRGGATHDVLGNLVPVTGSKLHTLLRQIWANFFKQPLDAIPTHWLECRDHLRRTYFSFQWHEVYDFLEFVSERGPDATRQHFESLCNSYLERENSAYRFVSGKITEITSSEEIAEVEDAILVATPYAGVKIHLQTALQLLSNRANPDYRNSIKESISAVESLAKQLAGDSSGTLGAVLKALERSKKLHPSLRNAFSALYGYTNDADGIRHGLLDEHNLTKADARFMLVCCSAFVNYAIEALNT